MDMTVMDSDTTLIGEREAMNSKWLYKL